MTRDVPGSTTQSGSCGNGMAGNDAECSALVSMVIGVSVRALLIRGTSRWIIRQDILIRGIEDPIIFDVGAHTGGYALLAKQAVPSARIFAFEPASATFARSRAGVEVRITSRERIQVTTIDSFCRTEGIARIALLKLDVEGHELAVLRGASRMLEAEAGSIDLFRIIPNRLVPIRFYGEHQEIFLTTNYLAILKPNRGV